MRLSVILLTLVLNSGLFSSGVSNPSPSLKATPQSCFEPCSVMTTTTLEPDYLNSALCLYWTSDNLEGKHCFQTTDGQYIPKTTEFVISSLPGGQYLLESTVFRAGKWFFSNPVKVVIQYRMGH